MRRHIAHYIEKHDQKSQFFYRRLILSCILRRFWRGRFIIFVGTWNLQVLQIAFCVHLALGKYILYVPRYNADVPPKKLRQ